MIVVTGYKTKLLKKVFFFLWKLDVSYVFATHMVALKLKFFSSQNKWRRP